MDETLKTLRRIQYAVIGVCGALLVLASTPREDDLYTAAIHEIRVLQSLPLDSIEPQLVASGVRALQEDTVRKIPRLEAVLRVLTRGHEAAGSLSFGYRGGENMLRPYSVEYSIDSLNGGTIGALHHYVTANPAVVRTAVDTLAYNTRIAGTGLMAKCLRGMAGAKRSSQGGMTFPESSPELAGWPVTISIGPTVGGTACYLGADAIRSAGNTTWTVVTNDREIIRIPVEVGAIALPQHSVKKWFRDHPHTGVLFDSIRGRETFLPALQYLWPSVENLSLDAAWFALNRERLQTAHQVSFLGLELDLRLATLLGPSLLLVLTAYLLANLAHARRLSTQVESRAVLEEFPWGPLFPAPTGDAIAWGSFAVLPVAAGIATLARTAGSTSGWTLLVSAVLFFCAAALGSAVSIQAHRLRRRA